MKSLSELGKLLHDILKVGGFWAQIFILILLAWPATVLGISLFASVGLVSFVAFVPFCLLLLGAILALNPLVVAAVGATSYGRRAMSKLSFMIGLQLAIGAYLSILPIQNDRGLVPLFLLLIFGAVLLFLGDAVGLAVLLFLGAVAVNIIFFMGGRGEVKRKIPALQKSKPAVVAQIQMVTKEENPAKMPAIEPEPDTLEE